MRLCSLAILAACLSGCGQQPVSNSMEATAHHGGRYLGIGVYPVSDLWQHLAALRRDADPHAATLEDDTQVIVVVDSNSGEIRQCGNMSGHCIGMNPWASPLGQGQATLGLDAHQADLTHAADAAANAAEAASQASTRHR
jgi:hypothetical protein